MNFFRDTAERLVWTVVAAMGGALAAGPIINISTLDAAKVAGLAAAVNFLTIVARKRLSVLPDPGDGLPALPVEDDGAVDAVGLVVVIVLLLILCRIFGLL